MSTPALKSCLNILRRTPPNDTEENLNGLAALLSPNEDAVDELFQRADAPLKDATDPHADNRPYLLCDHNRDGDSYRSPWSNTYSPALEEDGFKPSRQLRDLEIQFNEVFDTYTQHYYGKTAISSVYLWDKEDDDNGGGGGGNSDSETSSFAGCFLVKKAISGDENLREGFWNSVHIVDVSVSGGSKSGESAPAQGGKSTLKTAYKLTTTILISMQPSAKELSETNISGSLTRQHDKECSFTSDTGHIANIGKMIEDMEIEMRSNMDSLYIQKTREIVDAIRRPSTVVTEGQKHTTMLNKAIEARGIGNKDIAP